jgi:pantoate--beta-alanine ligase
MFLAETVERAREFLANNSGGKSLGLVPTMGFLHEGHISLVRRCRAENGVTAVSIFVNPIQFGPGEDLASYPRDMERDLSVLEQEGVDMVFAPLPEQMYADNFSVHVDEEDLSKGLCGASRPGHFRGVCTVVTKLFNIIRPDRAYFGQKDYQQLQVIKRMVRDLNMPVEVVSCPIVREKDGLAMSSRNLYLTPEERQSALLLNRSLAMARDMVKAGEKSQNNIRQAVMDMLNSDPALSIDYVELKDAEDLKDISEVSRKAVLALAVRVGRARLIDNTVLDPAR